MSKISWTSFLRAHKQRKTNSTIARPQRPIRPRIPFPKRPNTREHSSFPFQPRVRTRPVTPPPSRRSRRSTKVISVRKIRFQNQFRVSLSSRTPHAPHACSALPERGGDSRGDSNPRRADDLCGGRIHR
jgi:hypothetical protein